MTALFAVSGQIGRLEIEGRLTSSGEQRDVRVDLSDGHTMYRVKDDGCVVRYAAPSDGVGPGRVSGEITCPSAEKLTNDDAGARQSSCALVARFRFEDCVQ